MAMDQIDRPTIPDEARQDVDAFATHHADIVQMWHDPMTSACSRQDTLPT
jgi:hypothetical protein